MKRWRRLYTVVLLGALCIHGAALAQDRPPACPDADDLRPAQLYGLWQLTLWPEGGQEAQPQAVGALLFERHPDYPDSVRGTLRLSSAGNDLQATVAGDVSEGEFNLDESADGEHMSAVWVGEPRDCGREIRGTRRPAAGRPDTEPVLQFRLRRSPGWR